MTIEALKRQIESLGYTARVVKIYDCWGFILEGTIPLGKGSQKIKYVSRETYTTENLAWEAARDMVVEKSF